jgi:D-alanyl-D-alanine carboxypeptidase
VTPNGLHDDEHASTPRDIALILGQAIQYPRIVSTMQTETSTVAGKPIRNGNRFIYDRDTPFGQLIGGKTGFTSKAMYCLAFAANQHQHVRISVVLGAPKKTLMYQETRKLLTWSMKVDESKKA